MATNRGTILAVAQLLADGIGVDVPTLAAAFTAVAPVAREAGEVLVDEAAACAILGIKRSTLWAGVKSGRFPAPLYPSRGTARWRRAELEAYVSSLAAERPARFAA